MPAIRTAAIAIGLLGGPLLLAPCTARDLPKPVTSATVTIEGFQFQPASVLLKQGGSVTFVNKDPAPHTVTSDSKGFAGISRLLADERKTLVLTAPGVQNYHCDIHPSMTGTITVVK
ncbi:cupredoxin domain-containing protein [Gloeobacter kilaueensis]|uniref:Blue (Type1) copper domain-containing protein n=1 Tax=Gloeobacter kilaueensis (strain ATCC BAA-2537 / CCAP 1431/1 / ULC 316 / JS1) TaxID=1183438 RepID=U5QER4_GLOK1|nr:cupredoxin domain-containing protein [Gloeobacter kilaueensis]AGY57401.1 blue (type1) copper domain-containing protein [Gloeobacter kilaueensis JS1]